MNAVLNVKKPKLEKLSSKCPFVIVGAGPSLDLNINVLKKNKDKVIIFACERSIPTFKHHDLKPDYVTCVENLHEVNNYIEEYYEFLKDVPLIAPFSVTHLLAKKYLGPVIFTNNTSDSAWLEPVNSFTTKGGACVTHYGFYVAEALNASEILLIGSDLAFKDGKTHSRYIDGDCSPTDSIKVKGFYGDEVETSSTFKSYIDIFSAMIRETKCRVINATEGGAFIPGAMHKSLSEAVSGLPSIVKNKLYEKVDDEQIASFYSKLINQVEESVTKIFNAKRNIGKIEKRKPVHFFGFLKKNIQVLLNQCINTKVLLQYNEIRTNYTPRRFVKYSEAVEALANEYLRACEFILALNNEYTSDDRAGYLIVSSDMQSRAWLKEKYPNIKFLETDDDSSLSDILNVISRGKIKRLIVFNGKIKPDAWLIPGIECIDIKDPQKASRNFQLENYSLAVKNDEVLALIASNCGNTSVSCIDSYFED